jgi:hypothetical protein
MNTLKHSKIKNTAILFELLVRQIAADTMSNKKSPAITILKKHFKEDSELHKELSLYRTLTEEKFDNKSYASRFIMTAVASRKQLNESELRRAKYNLVRDIKNNFVFENFIGSRVNNYKLLASIYKLFEYKSVDSPADITRSFSVVTEHVMHAEKISTAPANESLMKEDPIIRRLASKIVIDRFNEKYAGLNSKQKELLREYVNSVNNSPDLLNKIKLEIPVLQSELNSLSKSVTSKVVKIKLHEVAEMLNTLNDVKIIQDKHVLTMLRYYELINQIKGVTNVV